MRQQCHRFVRCSIAAFFLIALPTPSTADTFEEAQRKFLDQDAREKRNQSYVAARDSYLRIEQDATKGYVEKAEAACFAASKAEDALRPSKATEYYERCIFFYSSEYGDGTPQIVIPVIGILRTNYKANRFEIVESTIDRYDTVMRKSLSSPSRESFEYYMLRARYSRSVFDYRSAIRFAKRATSDASRNADPKSIGEGNHFLGSAYRETGRLEVAVRHLQKALENYEKVLVVADMAIMEVRSMLIHGLITTGRELESSEHLQYMARHSHVNKANRDPQTGFLPASMFFDVWPQRPPKARHKNIEGWVKVQFTITKQGHVTNATILESHPSGVFDKSTLETVHRWHYLPAMQDDEFVDSVRELTIKYGPNDYR